MKIGISRFSLSRRRSIKALRNVLLGAWTLPGIAEAAKTTSENVARDVVSLVFAGDVALDDSVGNFIARGNDPFVEFVALLANSDIRICNLECVVATTGSAGDKYYTFRAHPRTLPVLRRHFDGVTIANNHSGDFGKDAFTEMLGLLQKTALGYCGGGRDLHEAHAPLILERKGLRIALLGYNEFMPRSFEAGTHSAGVAWSEDEHVVADIRAAKDRYKADIVIPIMHWGWENELKANIRQRELARTMIDAGADAVIGSHPHVRQDVDLYKGKPIIYSVGNFVMKETDNAEQRVGWLLRLKITSKGVIAYDTHTASIDMEGLPHYLPEITGPSWQSESA